MRRYGAPKQVSSTAMRLTHAVLAPPKLFIDESARQSLERRLQAAYAEQKGKAVVLSVTDNRNSMIVHEVRNNVMYIRLHHMFLDATPNVVNELIRYLILNEPSSVVDQYIADHLDRKAPRGPESSPYDVRGNHHDLVEIYNTLNARYFNEEVQASIVWGRYAPRKQGQPRRTIRLGHYYQEDKLIRIHPVLDNAWVPRYFITDVIHHEMLHQVFAWDESAARRCIHPPEFVEREKLYKWHSRAVAWQERNLGRLLRWG